jgi:hypothetical protein
MDVFSTELGIRLSFVKTSEFWDATDLMQLKRKLGPKIGLSCHSSSSNTIIRLYIMYVNNCQWIPSIGSWGQSTPLQSVPCRTM